MKFALLGCDAHTPALTAAIVQAGHELVAAAECDVVELDALREIAPRLRSLDDWESLLDARAADGVIVARRESDDDYRAEQLRKLVQESVPLLVAHPIHRSMLVYFELDMNRESSASVLMPYMPQVWHPALSQLVTLTQDESAELGHLQQVTMERLAIDRSKSAMVEALAGDVAVLRTVAGDLRRVSAMGSSCEHAYGVALSVQFSGPRDVLALWSAGPVEQGEGARLTVTASRGKAVLWIPAKGSPWTLEARPSNPSPSGRGWLAEGEAGEGLSPRSHTFSDIRPAAEAIARFAAAIAGKPYEPTWLDAAHDMELVDAVEISARRGRTIDVHLASASEQSTFKGMMAAGGCGLLMLALVLVIVATTAVRFNVPLAQAWPYFLVVLFGGFLALQLLRFVFPNKDR